MQPRTPLFTGFGRAKWRRNFWKQKTGLEVFKFGLYLFVPVAASVVYNDPKVMKWLIENTNFVYYPSNQEGGKSLSEGSTPQSGGKSGGGGGSDGNEPR